MKIPNLLCAFVLVLGTVVFPPFSEAVVTSDGYVRIDDGSEELLAILESLPFAVEGEGPVMWMFEFSECSYCQSKYRDFSGVDLGLQFRRLFVPVSERAAREAAALAKSRDPRDYHAYMQGRKRAPAFDRDNEAINAHNAIIQAASQDMPPILIRNGWSARGLVFPAYFWLEDGQLMANGGYLKANFEGAVARAKAGWNDASRAKLAGPASGVAPASTLADLAGQPKPLEAQTVFFLYHKLAEEPIDFDGIRQEYARTVMGRPEDREAVVQNKIDELRTEFEEADPEAEYTINVGTKLTLRPGAERLEADLFQPGIILPFNPQELARIRNLSPQRQVAFANAEAARFVDLSPEQVRVLQSTSRGQPVDAVAELRMRFVDAIPSRDVRNKTLRAQVLSVQYHPSSGTNIALANTWPLGEAFPIEASDIATLEERGRDLDDLAALFLFATATGKSLDFRAIAEATERVRRAAQFEKAALLEAETERIKSEFEKFDPGALYRMRVSVGLTYNLDDEQFEVSFFKPGQFFRLGAAVAFSQLGVEDRRENQVLVHAIGTNELKILFIADESAHHLALPRDEAAKIDSVHQRGSMSASAEVTMTFLDYGDPSGAAEGSGVLRMALQSIRLMPGPREAAASWPFEEVIELPPYNKGGDPKTIDFGQFAIVGLKTGIPLLTLKQTIEKEFGPIGAIRPPQNEDPRLVSGIGHNADGCYSFGNKVPEVGSICIRAYADEKGVARKIIVEQILEGAEWEPLREALLAKYGAMSESLSRGNNRYFAWGSEVAENTTTDEQTGPNRALTARLSAVQSAMDRMAASTRVSTNLRIRLIDPEWAGSPPAALPAVQEPPKPVGPRL